MESKDLMSILTIVFVIFACRTESASAGQAPLTCSRELNALVLVGNEKGLDVSDEDDLHSNEEPTGSSVFLSGAVELPKLFPIDIDEPSDDDEVMNAVREEMCEIAGTSDFREDAKMKLRHLLKEDKELKSPWHNEAWLVRFLRAKRYDVNETYKLIQKYYKFKEDYHKQFFKGVIPSKLAANFGKNILLPLPNRDQKGRRILLFRVVTWKDMKLNDIFVTALLLAEAAVYEPKTQLAGVQIVIDWEGFSWLQTSEFVFGSGTTVLAIIRWLQNSTPFRLKGLHIINPSATFSRIKGLFDKFATQTMKDRVHIHKKGTDLQILYDKYDFNKSNLPPMYGGTLSLDSANDIDWENILKYCDREFEEINSYGYNKN